MAESYAPPVMMSGPPMPMMMSMAPMMSRSSGMPHPAPPPAAFAAPAPGGSAPAPVPAPQVKTRTPPTNAVNAAPINEQSPPNYSEGQVETDTSILKYTNIPTTLESSFDVQNCGSIRPTIIKLGPLFTKKSQAGLIKSPVTNFLNSVDQKSERNKALDLLDALSRSGELVMDESTIHVVVVSTQCFDETLINQVIQKDCNPIDLIERSTLIMAKTLHGKPVQELLVQSALPKVKEISPCLFD